MTQETTPKRAKIEVENVGGIDETSVSIPPGVTVLAGRNATNRTSLLRALMGSLGSDDVSVKGDADEGAVELQIGDERYTRSFKRVDGSVVAGGDPYLEDSTIGDLFSYLLEGNPARRAVQRDANLREFIMRPIDTEEIQSRINRLVDRREQIEDELEQIEALKARLPDLEAKRSELSDEIEARRDELEAVEADIEAADTAIGQSLEQKQELEEKLSQLQDIRRELDEVSYDIETERETIEELRSEQTDLESTLKELPATPADEAEELSGRIDRLRAQKQEVETQVNELQSIISFNEELLESDHHEVTEALAGTGEESVTSQLLESGEVTCWTCGSTVETAQVRSTLDQIRDLSRQKLERIRGIDDEVEEARGRLERLETQQRERDQTERRLDDIDAEIDECESRLEGLREREEALAEEVADVETEVEALESAAQGEVLEIHREANQLEYEIGKLEGDRERVDEEVAGIESRLEDVPELEDQLTEVREEIGQLRTHIEDVEREAVEAFNEHMDEVLDLLDYENLERIWLERVETEVREGRRKVTKNAFRLHVVRTTESGATYEDTVAHLSESEREVTGLVFALAGYLAHDVARQVPFMLLDSLEAVDSDRIAALVDYLADHAPYLVVALLPEDADALDDEYNQITTI
jgi:DNA repair exonuclease SbcCD ATPase subunit